MVNMQCPQAQLRMLLLPGDIQWPDFLDSAMSLPAFDTLLQPDAALVVAFSGGLDSTVLLHQLRGWQQQHPQLRLRALHVHHGLSRLSPW